MRIHVLERDGHTCQYCGKPARYAEHVLARLLGGPTQPFNLVAACCRCNLIKGKSVWIPSNASTLYAINPAWKGTIEPMATDNREPLSRNVSVKLNDREFALLTEGTKNAGVKTGTWARKVILEEVAKLRKESGNK